MRHLAFSFFALLVLGTALACSSSSSGNPASPCNTKYDCPAGQTCWPADTAGNFKCLNSGPGKAGDICQNSIDAPTCGDKLLCYQTNQSGGTCTQYCDPTDPSMSCPNQATCMAFALSGTSAVLHACQPMQNAGDGGNDSGTQDSGGNDSGGGDSGGSDAGGGDAAAD
jgi:hypothetical protein